MAQIKKTNEKIIRQHLEADIPLLIYGRSGWGKSSVVKQLCESLGYKVIDLRLSTIPPEDIGGIPTPNNTKTAFEYLAPAWTQQVDDKTVVFLDEITQASVQTLHACYPLVLDRMVAGRKYPFKVIAASNYAEENINLTELMEPLVKRFSVYNWIEEPGLVWNYLKRIYGETIFPKLHKSVLDTMWNSLLHKDICPRQLDMTFKYLDTTFPEYEKIVVQNLSCPAIANCLQNSRDIAPEDKLIALRKEIIDNKFAFSTIEDVKAYVKAYTHTHDLVLDPGNEFDEFIMTTCVELGIA